MLSRRGADGQSVRIPVDGSRDVQASIQDVKDALRSLEAKHKELKSSLGDLEQRIEKGAEEVASPNFNEINDETVFNSPVTFSQGLFADGDPANPSISFSADQTLGGYRIGDGHFGISADGLATFSVFNSGGNAFFYVYDSVAPGTDRVRFQKNAGGPAYLILDAASANPLYVGTWNQQGDLNLTTNSNIRWWIDGVDGDIIPGVDNTYDIGDSTHAVADMHIDGDVHVNGVNAGEVMGDGHTVRVHLASVQAVATSTPTKVNWDTEDWDESGWITVTGTDFTVPVAGRYLMVYMAVIDDNNTNNTRYAGGIYSLTGTYGVGYVSYFENNASTPAGNDSTIICTDIREWAASDTFACYAFHVYGGNRNLKATETYFAAKRIGA